VKKGGGGEQADLEARLLFFIFYNTETVCLVCFTNAAQQYQVRSAVGPLVRTMRYKVQVHTLLLCAYLASTTTGFILRKCCPQGHSINDTLTGCERKHSNNNNVTSDWIIERGLLTELPPNFTLSILNGGEEVSFHIPCKTPQVLSLMWMEGDESDFHVNHVSGDLKPAASLIPGGPSEFNQHEYCLDELRGVTVALACPCIRGTCVNVCCERGMLVDATLFSK
jgi:hypothetical protein